jgi:hypothetical protein
MRSLSIVLSLIVAAAFASEAWAKRMPPKPVEPLVHNGVKYVALLDNGREGIIVAQDEKSGKKLWDLVVYTVKIDPNLEEDVQWVFITTLAVRDNTLVVTNEKKQQYSVDLKTKKIEKVKDDAKKTP